MFNWDMIVCRIFLTGFWTRHPSQIQPQIFFNPHQPSWMKRYSRIQRRGGGANPHPPPGRLSSFATVYSFWCVDNLSGIKDKPPQLTCSIAGRS